MAEIWAVPALQYQKYDGTNGQEIADFLSPSVSPMTLQLQEETTPQLLKLALDQAVYNQPMQKDFMLIPLNSYIGSCGGQGIPEEVFLQQYAIVPLGQTVA